jgi:uncharacterized protein involved in copper resistance
MKLFLLLFCIGVFVINARAEESTGEKTVEKATVHQHTKSVGDGVEHEGMSKEERKAMHADKHKMNRDMKKAMKEAKAAQKDAVKKARDAAKTAKAKKAVEPPPLPTEDQIKKADSEDEDMPSDGDDQD